MKKATILLLMLYSVWAAYAQNQSSMKTTNQKNVNVQKKNDEAETNRIRSKTPRKAKSARPKPTRDTDSTGSVK